MTNIVVGFSTPKTCNIASFLIRKWINKPYSHVYIRFESRTSEIPSNIYHASRGMVHFKTFENFLKENNVICEYKLEITEEKRKEILIHCMNLSGEKYAFMQLVKILTADILHFLGKHTKSRDIKGYICSELVAEIILDKSKELTKPIYLLRPDDIENEIKKWQKL